MENIFPWLRFLISSLIPKTNDSPINLEIDPVIIQVDRDRWVKLIVVDNVHLFPRERLQTFDAYVIPITNDVQGISHNKKRRKPATSVDGRNAQGSSFNVVSLNAVHNDTHDSLS